MEKWIYYMPMILDFMERLYVHDLLKIGYITCPFLPVLWTCKKTTKKPKGGTVYFPPFGAFWYSI